MALYAFGINHKTAPVAIREQATFVEGKVEEALTSLRLSGSVDEAAIISTCNRTELYYSTTKQNSKAVIEWFCKYHNLTETQIAPYIYLLSESEAVKHAFRVAAGLDSLVLGEPQILGQMKDAFTNAHKAGATGKLLNRLFQHTFSVAKQVRTETAIGANAVSVAFAAVSLAKQIFADLSEQTVMMIGAGEMMELAARHLREQNVKHMIVANRTLARAEILAAQFGAEAISLTEMPARLRDADIVISSTASQLPILGKGAVENAIKARKHKPIFMVDIAVPRDIEPEVAELDDIYLYTVDDLSEVVEENINSRQEAAKEAEAIIDIQTANFMDWIKSLDAVPTITRLRDSVEQLQKEELEKALSRVARGDDPQEVIRQLTHTLTKKFMHNPSAVLQQAGQEGNTELLDAARRLFDLTDD